MKKFDKICIYQMPQWCIFFLLLNAFLNSTIWFLCKDMPCNLDFVWNLVTTWYNNVTDYNVLFFSLECDEVEA